MAVHKVRRCLNALRGRGEAGRGNAGGCTRQHPLVRKNGSAD